MSGPGDLRRIGPMRRVGQWHRQRAARACVQHATSEQDLAMLLEMLGLDPVRVAPARSPVAGEPTVGAPSVSARRMVEALMCLGWTAHDIAARIGTTGRSLRNQIRRGHVSPRRAGQIAAVYTTLSYRVGPSRVTAGKARAYGYVPPWAWPASRIHDPAAAPRRHGLDVLEVWWLLDGGCPEMDIARRMRVSPSAVQWARQQRTRDRGAA